MVKRRKKPAKPSLRDRLAEFRPSINRPAAVTAAWIVGIAVLLTAWVMGVPRLEAHASSRHESRRIEVEFSDPPSWLKGELADHLGALARAELSPDPLQREDLVRVRAALTATGWFEQVEQVRRLDPGRVEVSGTYAHPVAVVREQSGTRDHLLDATGRLLPRSYPAASSGLTSIVGSWSQLASMPSAPWVAEEVEAALEVLKLVRTRPWSSQVGEIHVARDPSSSRITLRLITSRGCAIVWGRPPGQEGVGEVAVERKLQYLDYHHEQYGHIDRGMTGELDITGDVVVGR